MKCGNKSRIVMRKQLSDSIQLHNTIVAQVRYNKIMAKTDFRSHDEYIATFPQDIQRRLQELRAVIREAVPGAEEVISYQLPCFNHNGPILYYAAFKNHLTISTPPPTLRQFADDLKDYKTSVSVAQIPYDTPLPKALIQKIAQYVEAQNLKK
jgi:uncharacterized protein YdhG (YjbR/CyaY superfamily)